MADGMIADLRRDSQRPCANCPRAGSDAVTGLADRHAFDTQLTAALAGNRGKVGPAVLFLDLDRFKAVNDLLGHPAGDALLRAAAGRMRSALRPGDVAARLGGDEFGVLLGQADRTIATAVAARLVDLIGRPYLIEGRTAHVGVSIGIALSPGDGTDPQSLAMRADLALYQAKADGRGRFACFSSAMQDRAEALRDLESDLRAALALRQYEVHYQPQVDLAANRLMGFEALVRWRHPRRGLVPPNDFIPMAEDLGLIVSLGEWVLKTACAEAARWPGDLGVAVNVSARQFDSGRLPAVVLAALTAAGLPAARLELEITETALLRNAEAVVSQLTTIKAAGVQISLDDFGTGYSSLTQLRSFPFDRVKIDRSFADDEPVVRAIAALGASLGMRTTAEGVETDRQLQRLRRDGCTEVQGYLLSRPVPASAVADLIARLDGATTPPDSP